MSGRIRAAGASALVAAALGAAPAEARQDLREAWVHTSATQVERGTTVRVRDKVVNRAPLESRHAKVTLWLRRQGGEESEYRAGKRWVKRLRPRKSSRGLTRIAVPGSIDTGEYRVAACLPKRAQPRARRRCKESPTLAVTAPPATLLAAGDVADCSLSDDSATADILSSRPGAVALLGDGAYPHGSAADYAGCYDPTWGRVKPRTRPVPGDHDYDTGTAAGYFGYFGAAAGKAGSGWYSYELGAWHVVALNSVCSKVGCDAGSAQMSWLKADLDAHPTDCTLAYWHNPKYSAGAEGGTGTMNAAWDLLREHGAELVLSASNHDYERFAPVEGIRELVVGTGGAPLHPFASAQPAAEARDASTHGVLRLTLRTGGYDWKFIPAAGGSFTDAGSGSCH